MASVPRADGHSFSSASGTECVRELRVLSGLRVRSRGQVQLAGYGDSHGGENGPLRNPTQFLCAPHRDGCQWARHGRRVLRREAQHAFAKGEGGGGVCERGGDPAAALAFHQQAISQRARELQWDRRKIFDVQQRRGCDWAVRAPAQRLQGLRGEPRAARFFRTRSAKSRLLRRGGGGWAPCFFSPPFFFLWGV